MSISLSTVTLFEVELSYHHVYHIILKFVMLSTNIGGVGRVRNESDPHVVTGVLQKTLKELSPSPFYEVYEDILATEINEDSTHERQVVQSWLVKLPQDRFEQVRYHSLDPSVLICIIFLLSTINFLCILLVCVYICSILIIYLTSFHFISLHFLLQLGSIFVRTATKNSYCRWK